MGTVQNQLAIDDDLASSKIDQCRVPKIIDQNIRRFQILIHKLPCLVMRHGPRLVHRFEDRGNLIENIEGLLFGYTLWIELMQYLLGTEPVHPLHHKIRLRF